MEGWDGGCDDSRRYRVVEESADDENRSSIRDGGASGDSICFGATRAGKWSAGIDVAECGPDADRTLYSGARATARTSAASAFHHLQYAGRGLGSGATALRLWGEPGPRGESVLA